MQAQADIVEDHIEIHVDKKFNRKNQLKPFLKWPGGKSREIKYIYPRMPSDIRNFYEPFVGGGTVYFATNANNYFINDKSTDLIDLYNIITDSSNQDFFSALEAIDKSWHAIETFFDKYEININNFYNSYKDCIILTHSVEDENTRVEDIKAVKKNLKDAVNPWVDGVALELNKIIDERFYKYPRVFIDEIKVNLNRKLTGISKVEIKKGDLSHEDLRENLMTAFKSALYMYYRHMLNHPTGEKVIDLAVYYFIRNYTYSSMFRFNANGEFNVPYGGASYNHNYLHNKIEYMKSNELQEKLKLTSIDCNDFYNFLDGKELDIDDFMFIDPPYDTTFSTYDKNLFDQNDQIRLANYLINKVNCKWMVVIQNNEFIYDLYNKDGIYLHTFDKNYSVSFMARNNQSAEHLLITNYEIPRNIEVVDIPQDEEPEPIVSIEECASLTEQLEDTKENDIQETFQQYTETPEHSIEMPLVYTLDSEKMNMIYVPIDYRMTRKEHEDYIDTLKRQLDKAGYKCVLISKP